MISDYVQNITENEPYEKNQADNHGRYLKNSEGIYPRAIIVSCFYGLTIRFLDGIATGFHALE